MIPFERDIYVTLLKQHLEEEEEEGNKNDSKEVRKRFKIQ